MKKRIVRFSPWQSAKTLAVLYFALGILFAIPMGLISSFNPEVAGQPKPGIGFFVMPILYGLAGLIFVPLGCWIYNKVAGALGGIEFKLADSLRQSEPDLDCVGARARVRRNISRFPVRLSRT